MNLPTLPELRSTVLFGESEQTELLPMARAPVTVSTGKSLVATGHRAPSRNGVFTLRASGTMGSLRGVEELGRGDDQSVEEA